MDLRKTIYFGRRDKDITTLFDGIEDKHGEVSDLIKGLMRDGMKYRNNVNNATNAPNVTGEVQQKVQPTHRQADDVGAEAVMLGSRGAKLEFKARIGSNVYEGNKEKLERKLDSLL